MAAAPPSAPLTPRAARRKIDRHAGSPDSATAAPRRASLRAVGVFTGVYMIASAVGAVVLGNREFVFYIAVMVVLMGVVWGVHHSVGLSRGALWALSLWGLAHMAGGLVRIPPGWPALGGRVLYNLWLVPGLLKYDQVVHAYGFGVTTWVCWQGLAAAFANRGLALRPTAGLLVLVAAAGMGFGALNEVVEFVATRLVPETNVGGYENTGWDLVANLVGAAATAVAVRLLDRRRGS